MIKPIQPIPRLFSLLDTLKHGKKQQRERFESVYGIKITDADTKKKAPDNLRLM